MEDALRGPKQKVKVQYFKRQTLKVSLKYA